METVLTRSQKEAEKLEEHIQAVRELRGLDSLDVTGYVYRIQRQDRNRRTSCGKIFDILDDDDFGRQFGAGMYQVAYHCELSNGQKVVKTLSYDIGREYTPFYREYCKENGIPYEDIGATQAAPVGLLNGVLDKENIQNIFALVGGLKALLAPQGGGQIDQLQMIKALAEIMPKPQPIQDVFIQEAFKSLRHENKSPLSGIKEQLDLFGQMREVFATPEERAAAIEYDKQEKASPMDKILTMALDALPMFLDRFGGDIPQAAAALKKEKPMQIGMLQKSPQMQAAAFQKIATTQGQGAAEAWARGLGIQAPQMQAAARPVAAAEKSGGVICL